MRSSIITLVLLLSIGVSWAGDRNRIIALGVRNFTYTPKEGKETVGSALGSIANVLITGQNTTQQPQYKDAVIQSPNQKIPDRKTKCVIKTHINIKQNVIFSAKLKPV